MGTTPKTAPKAAVFCRLPTGAQLLVVNSIPVNYTFWFSNPCDALTASRTVPENLRHAQDQGDIAVRSIEHDKPSTEDEINDKAGEADG